jgi:hypothetical protein
VAPFFTQKSHAAPSRLQLHDSKKLVRASGIFDSHRPLHFWPSLADAGQLDLQLTSGGTLGTRWLALAVVSHAVSFM